MHAFVAAAKPEEQRAYIDLRKNRSRATYVEGTEDEWQGSKT